MDHKTFMSRPHPIGSTAWQITQEEKAISKAEGLIEGKAEGLLEGKAEGLVEGKVEGLLKGKAIGNMHGKQEVARNLLNAGFSIERVAELTGLEQSEIEKLPTNLS